MRTCLAATAVALIASAALAGPLNPPAGAVGASMKTLGEVEPRTAINAANTPGDSDSVFKITQPGSYYLTGNLTGVSGKCGIEITVSNVTIDFAGFTLTGVAGSLDGVRTSGVPCHNTVLRNGTIVDFAQDGVDLTFAGAGTGGSIENVHARGNGQNGISCGISFTVSRCTATSNGGNGIMVNYSSVLDGCTARQNGEDGLRSAGNSTFTGCTAIQNEGDGFQVNNGSVVTACSSSQNGQDGIEASSGSTVSGCSVQFNTADGIRAGSFCVVTGNVCESNGFSGTGAGVHITGSRARVEGNACYNADIGIDVDNANTVVVKNTCAGNQTNWSLAVGVVYGPIVDRIGIASAPVSGNSAAGVLNTTDPNANFTH